MSKTVKNISDQTLSIIGVGEVEAGKTVTVADDFNNPNFEVVKEGSAAKPKGADKSAEKSEAADEPQGTSSESNQ